MYIMATVLTLVLAQLSTAAPPPPAAAAPTFRAPPPLAAQVILAPELDGAERARMAALVERDWYGGEGGESTLREGGESTLRDDEWKLVDKYLTSATAFARAQGVGSDAEAVRVIATVANLHERRRTQRSDAIALSLNRHAAALGHAEGCYNLGRVYAGGLLDQEPSYGTARAWFEKAASLADHVGAFYALGHLEEHGLGGEVDSDKAKHWYVLAAELAHDQAMGALCSLMFSEPGQPPEYRQARQWCKRAIKVSPSDPHVQLALGSMYVNGWGGKKSAKLGFKWLTRAADHGLRDAQYRVGYYYSTALQNDAQARVWYTKAADQGHIAAAFNLGSLFQNGLGGRVDVRRALEWYGRAAIHGDHEAEFAIAGLYYNGDDGLKQDTHQAQKWMRKAAEGGHLDSMYWMGMLLLASDDIEDAETTAKIWLAKAARMGHYESEKKLKEISSESEMMEREFDLFNEHRTMRAAEADAEPIMIAETTHEAQEAERGGGQQQQHELDEIYYEEI